MTKKHGLTGRQSNNSGKRRPEKELATAHIHIKITKDMKTNWQNRAASDGFKSLGKWIKNKINE